MSAERRRHRVLVTKHTEYHLRHRECVGVRDRTSGLWLVDHAALRLHALDLPEIGDEEQWRGRRIQFWGSHTDVLTSPVVDYFRPDSQVLDAYVSHARSGAIPDSQRSELLGPALSA